MYDIGMHTQANYPIVDLHCDTLTFGADSPGGKDRLAKSRGHLDIPRMQAGGALLQCFAVFAPAEPLRPDTLLGKDPLTIFEVCRSWYEGELLENRETLAPVFVFEDIEKNRQAGKISALFTLEDGAAMAAMGGPEAAYEKGVRMVALTWNFPNALGFPNSQDPAVMERGLTDLGREAVLRMQTLGMVVDVSHLSDGGFWDVARLLQGPFLASHSNARAIKDHTRNLTDDQLRALADHGGAVGLNFCSAFVGPEAETTVEGLLRHAQHIRQVAGVETLALGSDFDGISNALEFGDYAGLPRLLRAFEKAFTSRELELISHKNALRVLRDCIP